MGKIQTNRFVSGHSGRPCRNDSIYTRTNRKTGKCYSVMLRNPSHVTTDAMTAHRSEFGAIIKALSWWINQNKVESGIDHKIYLKIKTAFERQRAHSTYRGFMMTKNMAKVQNNGDVTITFDSYSTTISAGTF